MKKGITILVADRNPHVREFLKRELAAVGYRVMLANNGRELLSRLESRQGVDLLVLDLDLPYAGDLGILDEVRGRIPTLPVVVHTFLPEYINYPTKLNNAAFVEKEGNSVDRLKDVISEVLNKPAPHFAASPQIEESSPNQY